MNLTLHLKRKYFDAIVRGEKHEEYRVVNGYWQNRIEGREYENIVFALGYPPCGDASRRVIKKWMGCSIKQITHPLFGVDPVLVYAIKFE